MDLQIGPSYSIVQSFSRSMEDASLAGDSSQAALGLSSLGLSSFFDNLHTLSVVLLSRSNNLHDFNDRAGRDPTLDPCQSSKLYQSI